MAFLQQEGGRQSQQVAQQRRASPLVRRHKAEENVSSSRDRQCVSQAREEINGTEQPLQDRISA